MAKAKKATNTTKAETVTRKRRNEFVGTVISDKMEKTISVEVYHLVPHTKYGKYVRHSQVFKAHDEKSEAKVGDRVRIFETRPLSKTKRWRLAEIVERRTIVEGVTV
jgi:small subunit ribosomal protein S17